MAGHLAGAGHQVAVYNRTRSKADQWVRQHDNASAPTPAEAADGAELVFMCVGNDDDVRAVTTGAGGRAGDHGGRVGAGRPHHDVGRRWPARWRRRRGRAGVGFVDAPVSGGQAGRRGRTLTVMCGGDDEDVFEQAAPSSTPTASAAS